METVALLAAWIAFGSLCTTAAGLLAWPFARPYLSQPPESYQSNVFATGFVWTFRAVRPATYIFAASVIIALAAWGLAELP